MGYQIFSLLTACLEFDMMPTAAIAIFTGLGVAFPPCPTTVIA